MTIKSVIPLIHYQEEEENFFFFKFRDNWEGLKCSETKAKKDKVNN